MSLGSRRLVLLVTADAPRSRRARSNLRAALSDAGLMHLPVAEVDLIADPSQAVAFRVFASPALVWAEGAETAGMLYGDLSDRAALVRFLADLDAGGAAPPGDVARA